MNNLKYIVKQTKNIKKELIKHIEKQTKKQLKKEKHNLFYVNVVVLLIGMKKHDIEKHKNILSLCPKKKKKIKYQNKNI